MAEGFKSGTRTLPSGTLDFVVSGLSLSFDPASVQVAIRQPSAEAELISAYVVGTATRDGFSVTLSSPTPTTGYLLDFTCFSAEVSPTPVEGDTLAVDYATLKSKVAYFLGYKSDSLTAAQTAKVDEIIQSGLRRFYYPPAMDGVDIDFEWSFIRASGTLSTEAGVGDYLMPNGFNRIAGQLVFKGDDSAGMSVPVIPYGDIERMRESNPNHMDKPRFAAIAAVKEFGTRGQRRKLYLYPKPDKAYTLAFVCDADQSKISSENPFPLGGAMYSELIIESCLAVAEQSVNDEIGQHTQMFNSLLISTIQRDRKSSAQSFGKVGDPMHRRFW